MGPVNCSISDPLVLSALPSTVGLPFLWAGLSCAAMPFDLCEPL